MKKIILTGGGSAGHVTPNLALVPKLKKSGYEILYIGSNNGIEKEIIEKNNIRYKSISTGKLRRYMDIKNFSDPFKVIKGVYEAYKIIKVEKPDVIFSKGGFVSVPVVIGGKLNKIPVIAHESDITPGLANKIAAPYCKKICVTFPESLDYIKSSKGELTGTPIRKELEDGNKLLGKKICGFKNEKRILMIIGGSLGSKLINDLIRNNLKEILLDFNIIHICGKGNLIAKLNNIEGYKQFEYVSEDLPHLMNVSDFFISRAGANVIFELLYLNKPSILIPLSKKASRGDQILNAQSFEKSGYSLVLEEEQLNEKELLKKLKQLKMKEKELINNMKNSEIKSGTDKIVNVIQQYSN
ncbi:MAG: undecaprenyldiphospho-muramoylpentapeptide beta-N-acetylglucosaminyltransferase [Clostridiaceae bacterium]